MLPFTWIYRPPMIRDPLGPGEALHARSAGELGDHQYLEGDGHEDQAAALGGRAVETAAEAAAEMEADHGHGAGPAENKRAAKAQKGGGEGTVGATVG